MKKRTKNKESADVRTEEEREAAFRKKFTKMKPMRLRKYAVTALKISASVVDEWNDFSHMVDYCVAKAMGRPLPDAEDNDYENAYNEEGEFDASEMMEDDNGDEEDYDNEMEGDGDGMFASPDDDDDDEDPKEKDAEPEQEPEKQKPARKRRKRKEKAPAPPSEDGDLVVQLQGLLDVITNQGAVLDKLKEDTSLTKSTVQEMYVRQEASHRALSVIAKTLFTLSTTLTEFVPRALKAMRYKPQAIKDIRNKAEAAGKDAEEVISEMLDPEAD